MDLNGIIPIIPTPFDRDEQIDAQALRQLLDFACNADVAAVCLPAYASEFYKLSTDERRQVIALAVEHVNGRVPVIAQANSNAVGQAIELARFAEEIGASAISVAVPRQFAVRDKDLFRYFDRILSSIGVPLVMQDFNPGGATVTPAFLADLHRAHPHFRWVKLEEPLMATRVRAIHDATGGGVGVIEGWGGMYLLELVSAGISGCMPGLGPADLLSRIWRLARGGCREQAYSIFQGVLPQIVYSLQSMELYHHAEKRLLVARGIIEASIVRDLRMDLAPQDAEYIDFLNAKILALLDGLKMPRCPIPCGDDDVLASEAVS
ncbi:MAG TPA: dihydrodipicolinate synthase family protein [Bryobacteraceae bacterium]|nr:dihydrodipicolinate synthase family protein [Bryobacteraceae bacterium]